MNDVRSILTTVTRLLLLSAAMMALPGSISGQIAQPGPGQQVYFYKTAKLIGPNPNPTTQQILDAMHGYFVGSLPTGWTAEFWGSVEARDTGIRDAETGATLLAVVVRDDIPDLDEAWLYVDEVVVFHATRSSGSVVNRGGKAVATMTVFLPPQPYDIRVRWYPPNSAMREHEVHVGP